MPTSTEADVPEPMNNNRKKSIIETLFNQTTFRKFSSSENLNAVYKREVQLMNDRLLTVEFTAKTLGNSLIREICRYLDMLDLIIYFGISYEDNDEFMEWLDLDKPIYKQIKDMKNELLKLRFVFYPPDPLSVFKNPTCKYLFYLQLRRDFYIGRLRTDSAATYNLAAYAIQADHGLTSLPEGFDIVNIPGGVRILPNIPKEVIACIAWQLQTILGMPKDVAEDEFIKMASSVETYGMEPFQVMDQHDNGLCIGFNHVGISAYKNGERTDIFYWRKIREVSRSGRHLVIVVPRKRKDIRLGFKAHSVAEAKMLLNRALQCRKFSLSQMPGFESDMNKTDIQNEFSKMELRINMEFQQEESDSSSGDSQSQPATTESSNPNLLSIPRLSLLVPSKKELSPPQHSPSPTRRKRSGSMDLRPTNSLDLVPIVYESKNRISDSRATIPSLNLKE